MPPRRLTAYERLEAIRRRSSDLSLLKEVWGELFPTCDLPETKWFELWLLKYDRDLIAESFDITEGWLRRTTESIEKLRAEGKSVPKELNKDEIAVLQYVQAVMKKQAAKEAEPEPDGDDLA
jgi:hypothetical protein